MNLEEPIANLCYILSEEMGEFFRAVVLENQVAVTKIEGQSWAMLIYWETQMERNGCRNNLQDG